MTRFDPHRPGIHLDVGVIHADPVTQPQTLFVERRNHDRFAGHIPQDPPRQYIGSGVRLEVVQRINAITLPEERNLPPLQPGGDTGALRNGLQPAQFVPTGMRRQRRQDEFALAPIATECCHRACRC